MKKREIDQLEGLRLLYQPGSCDPKALLLVSADGMRNPNIMPFTSWFLTLTESPQWHFTVYIFTRHHTHSLVEQTGQFTVNVPGGDMNNTVEWCGSVSGRDHDKFKARGLTPVPSRIVIPPLIGECPAQFECRTCSTRPFMMTFPGEDREDLEMTMFESEILAFYVDDDAPAELTGKGSGQT